MQELLQQVQRLLAYGEHDAAIQLCDAQLPAAPAARELGLAVIALARGDGAKLHEHAKRAFELGAGVHACQFLAISYVLHGNPDAAIEIAHKAVELEDTPARRAELGTVLLAARRPYDALSLLRQAVFEQPADHEARLNLATASVEIGDHTEAISHFARAFVAAPGDYRPIHSLINMFVDLGKWLGAAAAVDLARSDSAPPAEALVLDLVFVHVGRMISAEYPAPGVNEMADRAIESLAATSRQLGPSVQLTVAHTFVELGRLDDAARLLATVEPATDDDRAARHLVEGDLAAAMHDRARALECYVRGQAALPERADIAAKAIALLLEEPRPAALQQIAELLARVPEAQRATEPELMLQEARYLTAAGEPARARALLERVLRITPEGKPIAERARQLLAAEPAGETGAYAS